jgi:hypothetical protein
MKGSAYSNCLPCTGFRIWGDTYLSDEWSDESTHSCHATTGAQAQCPSRRGVHLEQQPEVGLGKYKHPSVPSSWILMGPTPRAGLK